MATPRKYFPNQDGTYTAKCVRCGDVRFLKYAPLKGGSGYCKKCCRFRGEYDGSLKKCAKCGDWKHPQMFPLRPKGKDGNPTGKDGRRRKCKDCFNAEKREWSSANRDKVRKYSQEWAKANPEKCVIHSMRRKQIMDSVEGSHTQEEFNSLCQHFGNKCLKCGEVKKLVADHIVPISKGGSNYISNIQPLCRECNSSKGTKDTDYRNQEND